ncbi:unnamed protein product, partial [Effrenium voratum]
AQVPEAEDGQRPHRCLAGPAGGAERSGGAGMASDGGGAGAAGARRAGALCSSAGGPAACARHEATAPGRAGAPYGAPGRAEVQA